VGTELVGTCKRGSSEGGKGPNARPERSRSAPQPDTIKAGKCPQEATKDSRRPQDGDTVASLGGQETPGLQVLGREFPNSARDWGPGEKCKNQIGGRRKLRGMNVGGALYLQGW